LRIRVTKYEFVDKGSGTINPAHIREKEVKK